MMELRILNSVLLLSIMTSSCLLVAGAPGKARTPYDQSANQYVDKLMANLGPHLRENNLDPLPLPDQVISFSEKILLITVYGSIGLTDGRIHGLSNLHRSGDCSVEAHGTNLNVNAKIGVNNLWGSFKGHAHFMGIGVNVQVSLAVDHVNIDARIGAALGSSSSAVLERFTVSNLPNVTFRFSGLGLLDWIINPVSQALLDILRGVLVKVVEEVVRIQINNLLKNVPLPLTQA